MAVEQLSAIRHAQNMLVGFVGESGRGEQKLF
jgi:hypothetical protein